MLFKSNVADDFTGDMKKLQTFHYICYRRVVDQDLKLTSVVGEQTAANHWDGRNPQIT